MKEVIVYYHRNDLHTTSTMQTVTLFSDPDRQNIAGKGLYANDHTQNIRNDAWSLGLVTYFFENKKDVLFFQNSLFINSRFFPEGTYKYQLIGGQGEFLGSHGTVTFIINKDGLRTVKFFIE